MVQLNWKPVEEHGQVPLPKSWQSLGAENWHPDLYARIVAFASCVTADNKMTLIAEPFARLGQSYQERFAPESYRVYATDPVQHHGLDALETLSGEFGDRLPALLWNTLAGMITRPDPYEDKSILDVQEYLPDDWALCDAALHALGVAYGLNFHVQTRLSQYAGHIILHGCGCNHFLQGLNGGSINALLAPERFTHVSREFLDHLLGQLMLIVDLGYPFRLNPVSQQSLAVLSGTR